MHRIQALQSSITAKAPEKTPEMQREIDRLRLQPKKIQVLEDQRRILQEFKDKADIDGIEFGKTVLGKLYEGRKKLSAFMAQDPDFNDFKSHSALSRDEIRMKTNVLLVKIMRECGFSTVDYENRFWRHLSALESTSYGFGPVATKVAVHCFLYSGSILALGNEDQVKYAQRAFECKDFGCFALTELTHGSNVQGCITTATYHIKNQQFVINTPNERGAKFWIGNAAQTANMAVVPANLIVKGKDYGIHMFLVPIRNNNHNLKTGVIIVDCGDKLGLQGVDNGMMSFRNVLIPRESLLNKVTQVAPDGTVTSLFAKKSKRFAVQLSALSDGRVKIALTSLSQALNGLLIASRFTSVRRQFGAKKYDEEVLINYPGIQHRIFPKYSRAIISHFAALQNAELWKVNAKNVLDPKNKSIQEMHALVSILKPLNTWLMGETTLEMRAVCGGLGYSSYSALPTLHADNHVNMTWEGDNTVLLQQTGRFILKGLTRLSMGKSNKYASLEYLTMNDLSEVQFQVNGPEDFMSVQLVGDIIKFMAAKSAQNAAISVQTKMMENDAYTAWVESLPLNIEDAAKLYGHVFIYKTACKSIMNCSVEANKTFLEKLLLVSGLTLIQEFSTYVLDKFSQEQNSYIQTALLTLYDQIKYNVVYSFDFFHMNDVTVHSAIGAQDGNCYDRLVSEIFSDRRNFGRPTYWRDLWKVRNQVV